MLLYVKQNAVVGSKKRSGDGGFQESCHNLSEEVISGSKRTRPSTMKIATEAKKKKKRKMQRRKDDICEREISNKSWVKK